jgi:site-specific DNA recombinase
MLYPSHRFDLTREVGSAKAGKDRTLILSIVDRMKAGDVLALADNSRFSRGVDFSRALWFQVAKKKCIYLEGGKVLDPSDPYEKAVFSVMAVFSELDNDIRIMRSGESMEKMKQEGLWIMGPTLGFDVTDGKVSRNEPEAALVQKMFELYAEGMGIKRILDYLYGIGAKGKNGANWSPTQVAQVLRNPIYIAKHHPGHRDVYLPLDPDSLINSENYKPAIVEPSIFWRVHELINAPDGRRPKKTEQQVRFSQNPYTSLVICYHCHRQQGRKIRYWFSDAGKWSDGVYMAPNHMKQCGCKMFTIPRNVVEIMWEHAIHDAFFTIPGLRQVNKKILKLRNDTPSGSSVQELQIELGQIEQRSALVYEKYRDQQNPVLSKRLEADFLQLEKDKVKIRLAIEHSQEVARSETMKTLELYQDFEVLLDKFLHRSTNRRKHILDYLASGFVIQRNYVIRWRHGVSSVFSVPQNRGPKRTETIFHRLIIDGKCVRKAVISTKEPRLDNLQWYKENFRASLKTLMTHFDIVKPFFVAPPPPS